MRPPVFMLVAVIAVCVTAPPARTAVPDRPISAVLVYAENRTTRWVITQDEALRATLEAGLPRGVFFHTEYLDMTPLAAAAEASLVEILAHKYVGRPIDLVVASTSVGLRFVLRYRDRLFSGAPIVFMAVSERAAADIVLGPNVTGNWLAFDWAGTLEAALRLQPKTRVAAVVTGASARDKVWLASAKEQLAGFANRLEIRYVDPSSLAGVLAEIAALPQDAIVLLGPFHRDGTGRDFTNVILRLAEVAPVPIYGIEEDHLGLGAVGGRVVGPVSVGEQAGRLALQALNGEIQDAPTSSPGVNIFDWRQMERWGLEASDLPFGSIVRYRPETAWQRYRWYVISAVAVVLVQALLIAALLLQRARTGRAERNASKLAGRLITAQEVERARIARDLHDDIGQRVASISIALSRLKRKVPEASGPAEGSLSHVQSQVAELSGDLRALSHDLHPSVLEHLGLVHALRARCKGFSEDSGVIARLDVSDTWRDVPDAVALCLYRVAQEALRNVAVHAHAENVVVSLDRRDGNALMSIVDDGCGFDTEQTSRRPRLGLVSLGERVRMQDGVLTVTSVPGHGTCIDVSLPAGGADAS